MFYMFDCKETDRFLLLYFSIFAWDIINSIFVNLSFESIDSTKNYMKRSFTIEYHQNVA